MSHKKNDQDEHFLENNWDTRRFVRVKEEGMSPPFTPEDRAIKRVSDTLKYGKRRHELSTYSPPSKAALLRIASGMKQAVLKVTSYGKGGARVYAHFEYISRQFNLPLEDQNGVLLSTSNEAQGLLSDWQAIYFDSRKNSRDTMHLMMSAPPLTCRETFHAITRQFLHNEFGGTHDYVFVAHHDTEHPHVHSVICLRSVQGKKLDPRKKFLNELRKNFAKTCREHEVMLDASRRFERGLSGKSQSSDLLQMRTKRAVLPQADQALLQRAKNTEITLDASVEKRLKRNQAIRNNMFSHAKSLYDLSAIITDEQAKNKTLLAAKSLLDYSKKMPAEPSRLELLQHQVSTSKAPKKRDLSSKKIAPFSHHTDGLQLDD